MGSKGGILQFDRINWIYLNYMLDSFCGPRNKPVPQEIKDFFATLYVVGGERLLEMYRGTQKLIEDDNRVNTYNTS